jgi:hypothetical protein
MIESYPPYVRHDIDWPHQGGLSDSIVRVDLDTTEIE